MSQAAPEAEDARRAGKARESGDDPLGDPDPGRSKTGLAFGLVGLLLVGTVVAGWPWLSAWNEHRFLMATVAMPDGQGGTRTVLIFHPTMDTPISERPQIAIAKTIAPVRIQTRSSVYVSLRAFWWSGWRWRSQEFGLTSAGDPASGSAPPTKLHVAKLGDTTAIIVEVYQLIDGAWALDGDALRDVSRSHKDEVMAWAKARRELSPDDPDLPASVKERRE